VASSSHRAAVPLCTGGAGVQRFSRSAWEDLLLKPKYSGVVFPCSQHNSGSYLKKNITVAP
jgi:hypothetical protein